MSEAWQRPLDAEETFLDGERHGHGIGERLRHVHRHLQFHFARCSQGARVEAQVQKANRTIIGSYGRRKSEEEEEEKREGEKNEREN